MQRKDLCPSYLQIIHTYYDIQNSATKFDWFAANSETDQFLTKIVVPMENWVRGFMVVRLSVYLTNITNLRVDGGSNRPGR
jgi:hypothetical protein